jgi:DNA adenine methylase
MESNPLKWHGGKTYLAKWVLEHAPESYVHYVEPYFGGGAVLFAREAGKSEVVNDLNGHLTNFWTVLRDPTQYRSLQRMLDMTPVGDESFRTALRMLSDPDKHSDLERAWAFFVQIRQSRQAIGKDFLTLTRARTRRQINEQASAWLRAVDGLGEAHARLEGVVVLNRPAVDVIRQQDGPETWFYLDPPYLHQTRTSTGEYGDWEMTEEDHADLLTTLSQIKGKFALSGYPSKLYDEMARAMNWRLETKQIDNKASSSSTKPVRTECLWLNY